MVVVPGVSISSSGAASSGGRIGLGDDRDLAIGGVAARLAQDEDVLAGGVEDHELVGQAAAHHPDVGADRDRVEPEPLEDPDVRAVLGPVAGIQARLVAVAAVGVLHHELADADQAAPGPRLVAPLGLEVVDLQRELAPGLDDVGEEQGDDLLVGHRQDHVPSVAILEPGQLRSDRVEPAARAPDVGGVDDRHLQLLAADRVLLLADDLLDPVVDPLAERQQRVDAGPELADVARADEQTVRRHLGVGRIVTKGAEEELGETHPRRIAGAPPRDCQAGSVTSDDHAGCRMPRPSSSHRTA